MHIGMICRNGLLIENPVNKKDFKICSEETSTTITIINFYQSQLELLLMVLAECFYDVNYGASIITAKVNQIILVMKT